MQIVRPGHAYRLRNGEMLSFVEKVPAPELDGLVLAYDGTTNEEVIEVLIDRLMFLNRAMPCRENRKTIAALLEAMNWLEFRTHKRVAQHVEGTDKPHV
jgi:hypothetical protein